MLEHLTNAPSRRLRVLMQLSAVETGDDAEDALARGEAVGLRLVMQVLLSQRHVSQGRDGRNHTAVGTGLPA
jgi:hypothetical protein